MLGASDGAAFASDSEKEFMSFLDANPDARLALQTMLMRYAYTLTFEAMPAALGDRLAEIKGSVTAVRFLLDIFSTEDRERVLSMTRDDLTQAGEPATQRPFG